MTGETCLRAGKTRYATTGDAHKAIASLKRKRVHALKVPLHVYRCSHCGDFHTTKRDAADLRRIVGVGA